MKSMKRFMALLLVVVMTLAMGTTVFAAGTSEDDKTGSIEILNTDAFDPTGEYTAYQIFGVTYDGKGNYCYTISSDSDWYATVKEFFELEETSDEKIFVATAPDGFSAAVFAAALKEALGDMDPAPEGTTLAGKGEEELALGYWFVTTTTGSLCNLTTTDPEAKIRDKNEPIPFKKEAGSEEIEIVGDVQLGQLVPYVVSGKVPSTVGYEKYIYKVSDNMTGAIFQNDVAVMFGTTSIDVSEIVEYTGNGFVLELDMTEYQDYVAQPITITYSAIVNDSSLTPGEVENTATLEHSHDPANYEDTETEPEWKIILKTFNIDLTKIAEKTESPLAGAKFVLQNEEGKYYTHVYGVNKIDSKGRDVSTKDEVVWVESLDKAMVVTTDEEGKGDLKFEGLESGTYKLVETKSPAGFNLPKDPFEVVITRGEKHEDYDEETDTYTIYYDYTATVNEKEVDITDLSAVITTIENKAGVLLPETGGFGTTMLILLGSILFMATSIVLVTKKRMYNQG